MTEPLIPTDKGTDRPLLVIIAIMAFLAAITLLLSQLSLETSRKWVSDLDGKATVQIYVTDKASLGPTRDTALNILRSPPFNLKATALSETQSTDLLRPWLGDLVLPDDLILPVMIRVEGTAINKRGLAQAFTAEGLDAEIDDHQRWAKNIKASGRGLRLGSLFILSLVSLAALAAIGFATQSALHAHKKIIQILTQIGAQDMYIIRLFIGRFFKVGFKGAAIGAALAGIILFILPIMVGAGFRPVFLTGGGQILTLLGLIFVFSIMCAAAAGVTSLRVLRQDRQ